MVNLIAGRRIVPELIQNDMTPGKIAAVAEELLSGTAEADRMRADLASVRAALTPLSDPFRQVATVIAESSGVTLATSTPA
jgi:lipid-A-disaccharide synthase